LIFTTAARCTLIGVVCLVTSALVLAHIDKPEKEADAKRPKLTLRAQPSVATAPARVTLTAELVGGANDYQDFYCPVVEWIWGDGTRSESQFDCEPYEPGKSEIRRYFTVQHVFRSGFHHVIFRLKRGEKDLSNAAADLRIQPNPGEIGDFGLPGRRGGGP
jgi:hypothetical protein